MVYFICGHRGCGKTYVINQIKSLIDCDIFDTGPILREQYRKTNQDYSFGEWIEINEQKYGKNFTNNTICQNMELNFDNVNIIIGNRSMDGISYAIEFFGINEYKIIFIDGNYELFRLNYNKREKTNLNFDEFSNIIELENSMGINEIKNFVQNNLDKGLYFYKESNDDVIFQNILDDIKSNKKSKVKTKFNK